LDIFVELVVLTLAHGQGTIEIKVLRKIKIITLLVIETHNGLSIFISAICLNMTASEMMCNLEITEKFGTFIGANGAKKFIRPLTSNTAVMIAIPIIWGLTGACLACAWYYPFLLLTASFLHHYSYNLFQVGYFMFTDGYPMFGVMVSLFVVIIPTIKHISIAMVWIFDQKVRKLERNLEIVKAISKWAMVDVFTIAYCIFSLVSD